MNPIAKQPALGILNSTKTKTGSFLLKQWFLRPSLSLPLLQQRHSAISCFLRSENTHIVAVIGKSLTRIRNIPKVLTALRKGKAKASDWSSILQVGVTNKGTDLLIYAYISKFSCRCLKIRSLIHELEDWTNQEILVKVIPNSGRY